ncbi:MAG: hypothetical protein WA001_01800 [Patescibacteria group bacterium]
MAIFYTRTQKGDKVIYAPIGKRAAILGYGWFLVIVVTVFIYQINPENVLYFLPLLAAAILLLLMPSIVNWVDGLPSWFPISMKRDGFKVFRLSWEGKETVVSAEDEKRYNAMPKVSAWFYVTVISFLVLFSLALWYWIWVRT